MEEELKEANRRIKTLEVDLSWLKRTIEKLQSEPRELHYHYTTRIDNLYTGTNEDFNIGDFSG